jgi:hypothetical protein
VEQACAYVIVCAQGWPRTRSQRMTKPYVGISVPSSKGLTSSRHLVTLAPSIRGKMVILATGMLDYHYHVAGDSPSLDQVCE